MMNTAAVAMTTAAAALEWHDVAADGGGKAIGAAVIRSRRLERWIVGRKLPCT